MKYAIEDLIPTLINFDPNKLLRENRELHYICALLSELAYLLIPEFELDDDNRKRAILVPCDEFQKLVALGIGYGEEDIKDYLKLLPENNEIIIEVFVESTNSIVALCLRYKDTLFIAFRGTIPSFAVDRRADLNCKFVNVPLPQQRDNVDVHEGFFKEADLICRGSDGSHGLNARIRNMHDLERVYLTGHSLGAAVAAISETRLVFQNNPKLNIVLLGCPKYSNRQGYYESLSPSEPIAFRRIGDLVPTVPPFIPHIQPNKYIDVPNSFDSRSGKPFYDFTSLTFPFETAVDWAVFSITIFGAHAIKEYRKDLGALIEARNSQADQLAELRKLNRKDLKKNGVTTAPPTSSYPEPDTSDSSASSSSSDLTVAEKQQRLKDIKEQMGDLKIRPRKT